VLTASERRKLEICAAYKTETPRPSYSQLAKRFGVSDRTIVAAIRWGERMGVFTDDIRERLQNQLIEWRTHLAWLEGERKLYVVDARDDGKRKPLHPYCLTAVSREIREVRTRIAELEGLIRNTLTVEHTGSVESQLVIVRPKDTDDND
jgi:hypothetical protein